MRRARTWLAVAGLSVASGACVTGPPWYLGQPLDNVPAIPDGSRALTVAERRHLADDSRGDARTFVELEQLLAIEARQSLRPEEQRRLIDLLLLRTRDWVALRRSIPLAADLGHIVQLDPDRAYRLGPRLRAAEIAAGDEWLAIGQSARAEQEYRRAEKRGGDKLDVRFRAAWGASIDDLSVAAIERAMAELPERVLGPFTTQYLDRAPNPKPRLLWRGWSAARVFGPPALLARLEALPVSSRFRELDAAAAERTGGATAARPPAEREAEDDLDGGPTLARTVIPAARANPRILDPGARSQWWSEHLLAEDPTAPDSLEVAAMIDARAGRFGGAARKLRDLVYYSADRAAAYGRAARVWQGVGRTREECAAWGHATRVGPTDDRRWCDLLACVRRDPGAGDAHEVEDQIKTRAPLLACVALSPAPALPTLPDEPSLDPAGTSDSAHPDEPPAPPL